MLHAHSIHGLTLRAGHVWPVWCAAATCGGAAHFPALLPGRLPKVLALTIHYLRVLHTLACDGLPSQARLSEHIIFVWILIGAKRKHLQTTPGHTVYTASNFNAWRSAEIRYKISSQEIRPWQPIKYVWLVRFQLTWKISVSGIDYPRQRLNIRYQISETNTSICYYSWLASSATYRACSASSSSHVKWFSGNINVYTCKQEAGSSGCTQD